MSQIQNHVKQSSKMAREFERLAAKLIQQDGDFNITTIQRAFRDLRAMNQHQKLFIGNESPQSFQFVEEQLHVIEQDLKS